MKKRLQLLAVIFFVCLPVFCPQIARGATDDLIKKVQPATVMVLVYDQNGNMLGQGSGFMLNTHGHLITNHHVLGKAATARVRTSDGREFKIKAIQAQAPGDDLIEAIVDVSSGSLPYLTTARTAPKPGDPVMVIGSPYGVGKVASEGTVTAIQEVPKYGRSIIHSAHSFPGSSGSPLVNAQGEVIGIATAAVMGKPDINLAVPAERFSGLAPNFRQLGQKPSSSAPDVNGTRAGTPVGSAPPETRAADINDPATLVRLAVSYEDGQGVPRNCFEALNLYRKAANQGYAPAEFNLGRMYYEGSCMGKNLGEAVKWVGKAAQQGFPEAQTLYANLYFNGEGVQRDRVTACMWTILAASRGQREAIGLLRYMGAELSPAEVEAAREKARNWKPVR
ncbi:MAG: bifunctional trypsin-like peptidase domain-containing/SEL1-like repeat protein [Syntrophobacter sp.]